MSACGWIGSIDATRNVKTLLSLISVRCACRRVSEKVCVQLFLLFFFGSGDKNNVDVPPCCCCMVTAALLFACA